MKKDYFLGLSEEGFHKVVYQEWGQPNTANPPCICVHGLTRNSHDFDALAGYLSQQGQHVFCPDIVGRGDSDWLKNPGLYTYEQYIADMNTLIARTQAKAINWIGTSMGGLLGMILAAQPNTPIKRLVLNDVGAQIPVKALTRLSKYVGLDPEFTDLDAAKKYYQSIYRDFGTLTDEQWQHLTENNLKQLPSGKYVSKLDQGVKYSSGKSALAWKVLLNPRKALEGTFLDIDLWEVWRKVTCPVLVIHGAKSDLLLPNIIEKMRRLHSNVEVIEVANAGHAPALLDVQEHEIIHRWLMKN